MDLPNVETPPAASYSLPPGRFWTEGGHRYWQPDPPPGPDSMTTNDPNDPEVLAWVEARRAYWEGVERALRILCPPRPDQQVYPTWTGIAPGLTFPDISGNFRDP